MSNKASGIDREAWIYTEKPHIRQGWGSRVRLGLFIVATGVVAMATLVALLHVAQVIP
jgi:hypothetical protein